MLQDQIKAIISSFFLSPKTQLHFFGDILLQLQIKETKDIPTLAVGEQNNKIVLHVNKEFFDKLSYDGKVYVLSHEIFHLSLQHIERSQNLINIGIPMDIINIAADLSVNSMLDSVPKELKDLIIKPGYGQFGEYPPNLSMEEYIKMLLEDNKNKINKPSNGNGNSGGGGNSNGNNNGYEGVDSHSKWGEINNTTIQEMSNKIKEIGRKYKGHLPGILEREIEIDYIKRFNWKFRVKSFISSSMSHQKQVSYAIPNRRFPDKIGEVAGKKNKMLGKVFIFIDNSGSISDIELKQFTSLALSIPYPKELYFIDAEIQGKPIKIHSATCIPKKISEYKGGGGTDFRPAFELAKQKKAKIIIYFTDLMGEFPKECDIPTVWVTTSDSETPPFGEVINIRKFI